MITVFTPIYNRAYCIEKLYISLCAQTDMNFEWLIIDDGSTDDVDVIINSWINNEKRFEIRYYRSENGGKMRALNKAVKLARYPAFFIVDSDDYLSDNAIERINIWFETIKDDDSFAGVSGLRKISTIDTNYTFSHIDCTNLERRDNNLVLDMAECYKTEILKKYPALEIEDENYLLPSYVWNSIAKDGYKIRYFNDYIYYTTYLPDGLSSNNIDIRTKNPKGWAEVIKLDIECKKDIEFAEMQFYIFYKQVEFEMDYVAKLLNIPEKELNRIILDKPSIINKMNLFFQSQGIRRVAIYGLGGEAKRFLQICSDLNIDIEYGIDRIRKDILEHCYTIEEHLPFVDAVLITNRAGIDAIRKDLEKRINYKVISLQDDILEKSFNYYFSDI